MPQDPHATILRFRPRQGPGQGPRHPSVMGGDGGAGPGTPAGRRAGDPGRDGRQDGCLPFDRRGAGGASGRRFLSLHLPDFAMERWLRRTAEMVEDLPFALAVEGTHGPVVHAATRVAGEAGVHLGARVADARAVCPGLRIEAADLRGDAAALWRLALWARRWCPWTAVEAWSGPGLMMDTTGSDHLTGGEAALMAEIEGRLEALGLTARAAIAPTQGAAWALARHGTRREALAPEGLAARMAPLPVRALRLSAATVTLLKRLGLKTVGDLAAVPRLSLARRFAASDSSANPLLRLDQMTGRVPEPLSCPDDPPRFAVRAALAEPIQDPTAHIPGLCDDLAAMLGAEGFGARRLALSVYRSDGEVSCVEAATGAATRDPGHMARLFEGRLERLDPGYGFDLITLGAVVAEPLGSRQPRLDGGEMADEELSRLIDRLAARFGPGAVQRLEGRESHLPERREAFVPAMMTRPPRPPLAANDRPLRLFDPAEEVRVVYAVPEGPPAQFVWRRVTHRVARFSGPERIAPEWWRERAGTRLRDYFRVEDQEGSRFWLYREGLEGDGRGGTPRWFVHGAFG